MGVGGWMLLLAAVSVIGYLLYKTKAKQEAEEIDLPVSLSEPLPVKTPVARPVKEVPEPTVFALSLYTYRQETAVRRCPVCDGENDQTQPICRICGSQLGR